MAFLDREAFQDELALFEISVDNENEVIWQKLGDLGQELSLNEEQLASEWVALSSAERGQPSDITVDGLRKLEHALRKRQIADSKKNEASLPSKDLTIPSLLEPNEDLLHLYGTPKRATDVAPKMTPVSHRAPFQSPATFSPIENAKFSAKYKDRQTAMEVLARFGETEGKASWSGGSKGVTVEPLDPDKALTKPYKYMYEKIPEIAELLGETIETIGMRIVEDEGLDESRLISLQTPCNDCGLVMGQICCDSEGRLNAASTILQGADGLDVPLALTEIHSFSFFPGQVTVLEGYNPSRKLFIPTRQLMGKVPSLAPIELPHKDLESLEVVMAGGPLTTSDSVAYEPLYDLLQYVMDKQPHLLVLTGPFVDVKNEKVSGHLLDKSYQELFDRLIVRISQMLLGLRTQVLLVPNPQRDAQHSPIYPSFPYRIRHAAPSQIAPNVHVVSDPCQVKVGGVVVFVSGTDVLLHLSSEEINAGVKDRIGSLLRHLMVQRSVYPLYPPQKDLSISLERLCLHCSFDRLPHLLISPSDLRYFIKEVEGVVCVNPGRLSKGPSGGSFARVSMDLRRARSPQELSKFSRAQVLRI